MNIQKIATLGVIAILQTPQANAAIGEVTLVVDQWRHLEMTTAYSGAPFNVWVLTCFGSLIGAWQSKGVEDKKELILTFFSSMILAITATVFIPSLTPYQWENAGVQGTASMFLAYTAQTWGPRAIEFIQSKFFKDKPDE